MKKDVNRRSVILKPMEDMGAKLKLARESKGISVIDACESLSKLTSSSVRREFWYRQEGMRDIPISKLCLLFSAIGIVNIIIDDLDEKDIGTNYQF